MKIDAVLKMEAPKTLKGLPGFIGMVKIYCNMWPHRAHILTPLMSQTGAPKNGRNASCIRPNESTYSHGRPLRLSKPQQAIPYYLHQHI
jgi:hypothetical protein